MALRGFAVVVLLRKFGRHVEAPGPEVGRFVLPCQFSAVLCSRGC